MNGIQHQHYPYEEVRVYSKVCVYCLCYLVITISRSTVERAGFHQNLMKMTTMTKYRITAIRRTGKNVKNVCGPVAKLRL